MRWGWACGKRGRALPFGQADRTTLPPSHDIPAGGPRMRVSTMTDVSASMVLKLVLAWLNAVVAVYCCRVVVSKVFYFHPETWGR